MASIGDVFLRLVLDDKDFEDQVVSRATKSGEKAGKALGAALTDFGGSAMKIGKSMTRVGDSVTRNVTLPILAAGGATAHLALDFDTTMNQIVGLANVPRDQIAGVRKDILEMAGDVGRSPQELAEAFYFVASAGFKADEAMQVLQSSAKAAAAGMGDTQDIAKVLGGVINAYGHDNLTAAHAADVLTAAIQDGSAEASDFAGVIGTVAPGAAALGVSFDQVTAALSGMTNVGISADEAATSLTQVFSALQKPTVQAENAMKGLGTSSAALRQELREKGLLATLRDLEQRFNGNETATAAVFGNIRALRGVTALLSLDQDQLNGIFADTSGALGTLQQAYDDTEGPQREIARSMAELQATAIEIGEDVLPVVVDILHQLAGGAKEFGKWWHSLDDDTKRAVVQWAGFLAIAGPVLSIVGRITTGLGGLTKGVGFLTKKIPLLGTAIRGLLGPIGLVIAGAEALKLGLDELTDGELSSENAFIQAAQASGDWNKAMQLTSDGLKETGMDARDFRDAVVDAMDKFGYSFEQAVDYVVNTGKQLPNAIPAEEMGARAKAAADMVAAGLHGSLAGTPTTVADTLAGGAGQVGAGAEAMLDPLEQAAADAHKAVVDQIAQMFKDLTSILTNREQFDKEAKDFAEGAKDAWSDAGRKSAIEAQLASKALTDALKSDDSRRRQQAIDRVNDLLEQYNLLAPGAMAAGELMNPALKKAIDKNAFLAIGAAEEVAGASADALVNPEDWEAAGLGDLSAFIEGYYRKKALAAKTAADVAKDAARAAADQRNEFHRSGFTAAGGFNDGVRDQTPGARAAGGRLHTAAGDGASGSLYVPGYNVGQSWVNGLIAALRANRYTIAVEAGRSTAGLRGKSPPKEGPLREIDKWGFNVASAWTGAFVQAIRALDLNAALGGMRGALATGFASPGLSTLPVPSAGVRASTAASVAGTGSSLTQQWILNVDGVPKSVGSKQQAVQELEKLSEAWG